MSEIDAAGDVIIVMLKNRERAILKLKRAALIREICFTNTGKTLARISCSVREPRRDGLIWNDFIAWSIPIQPGGYVRLLEPCWHVLKAGWSLRARMHSTRTTVQVTIITSVAQDLPPSG